jgi:hypothetical protein
MGAGTVPEPTARAPLPSWAWVLIVLAIGALFGELIVVFVHPGHELPGPGPYRSGLSPVVFRQAIVLATMDLGLLLALVYVYAKTWVETRARFAIGLVLFLVALTLHTLFGSPFTFVALGFGPGGLGAFLFLSTLFETVALAIFLWLSLA